MSAIAIALIAFACIFAGSFFGIFLRKTLPEQHLSSDAKDIVRSGTSLIATISGLVLGLLVGSASSTYSNQSSQIKQLTANMALLDLTLQEYGPEAQPIRVALRRALPGMIDRIWSENSAGAGRPGTFEAGAGLALYTAILKLTPANDFQRALQSKAIDAANDMAKNRLLLFTTAGRSIPMPFLVVLISWLALLFTSYSLFAQSNTTTKVALGVFSVSAAAAIFLILELSEPFSGLLVLPDTALRNAVVALPGT